MYHACTSDSLFPEWETKNFHLWPRVEQRKWILAKNKKQKQKQKQDHQKNKSTGRITRRNKRKTRNKTRKKQNKKNLHFPQFCFCFFSCFFIGFGFLVCFFCLHCFYFLFFCQTLYSLCCWTHKLPCCMLFKVFLGRVNGRQTIVVGNQSHPDVWSGSELHHAASLSTCKQQRQLATSSWGRSYRPS